MQFIILVPLSVPALIFLIILQLPYVWVLFVLLGIVAGIMLLFGRLADWLHERRRKAADPTHAVKVSPRYVPASRMERACFIVLYSGMLLGLVLLVVTPR